MSPSNQSLLISGEELTPLLGQADTMIIDLSRLPVHAQQHIPGAVHLDLAKIMANRPPVMGLLPESKYLEGVLGALGATSETHIIAYDEEANAKACRLLWTLDCLGHQKASLLDGGLQAWMDEERPVTAEPTQVAAKIYQASPNPLVIADRDFIRKGLDTLQILDVRSPGEYEGIDKRATRSGHIPGAINIEWTEAIDRDHMLRLKPIKELEEIFLASGMDPDRETVVHCQTHQRSAHTYFVLKLLGFKRLRGYPGSWSDWGNDPEPPIVTGSTPG